MGFFILKSTLVRKMLFGFFLIAPLSAFAETELLASSIKGGNTKNEVTAESTQGKIAPSVRREPNQEKNRCYSLQDMRTLKTEVQSFILSQVPAKPRKNFWVYVSIQDGDKTYGRPFNCFREEKTIYRCLGDDDSGSFRLTFSSNSQDIEMNLDFMDLGNLETGSYMVEPKDSVIKLQPTACSSHK